MGERFSILVIDDQEMNQAVIAEAISGPDRHVVQAQSGAEARGLARNHDFALFLIDIMLPDVDGFEIAAELRTIEEYRSIPIIFITSVAMQPEFMFRGYELGAIDYLIRPIHPAILRGKVDAITSLYWMNRLLQEQLERAERLTEALRESCEALSSYGLDSRSLPGSSPGSAEKQNIEKLLANNKSLLLKNHDLQQKHAAILATIAFPKTKKKRSPKKLSDTRS